MSLWVCGCSDPDRHWGCTVLHSPVRKSTVQFYKKCSFGSNGRSIVLRGNWPRWVFHKTAATTTATTVDFITYGLDLP